jgi:hypothetical protein
MSIMIVIIILVIAEIEVTFHKGIGIIKIQDNNNLM